jgi:2-aminoadipate transaminase
MKYWAPGFSAGKLRTMNATLVEPLELPKADRWENRFADRTRWMRGSAVRSLLRLTAQPDMISLAGGLPAPELLPHQAIQMAADQVLTMHAASALQYGETAGWWCLREWIAHSFRKSGLEVGIENVLITSGAQQGLDLIGRVFLNRGDGVLVENPTYLAALSAWRPWEVEFAPVRCDAEGICVDDLPALINDPTKLAYTMPNFQNPQGTTLSQERRVQLVRSLQEREIVLVEDNPYGDLRYSGRDLPHLVGLGRRGPRSGSNVLHIGTFSKVLAPGLRVGWVLAPEQVIDKLVLAKQAVDLHTSTLAQCITFELVSGGFLEQHVPMLRAAYKQRRDALLAGLDQFMPDDVSWTRPDGGMFLLVRLPDALNATDVLAHALQRKVAFVPGDQFHLDGQGTNTLRLNFTNAPPERLVEGARRLADAVHEARAGAPFPTPPLVPICHQTVQTPL